MLPTGRLRLLIPALLAAGLLLASAATAAAKFPYFSVTLDPPEPMADEPITVTVRTWADADHSQPSGFTYERSLHELVHFQRRDAGTGSNVVPVALWMVEPDLFRGEVTLPVGEWRLWAFPHGWGAGSDDAPGYPSPIDVVVREDAGLAGWAVPATFGGALAAAVAGAVAMKRRRMRAPHQRLAPRPTSAP